MITPKFCLICGADWHGLTARPGEPLPPERRVIYECGATLSYRVIGPGVYSILTKNCEKDYTNAKSRSKIMVADGITDVAVDGG